MNSKKSVGDGGGGGEYHYGGGGGYLYLRSRKTLGPAGWRAFRHAQAAGLRYNMITERFYVMILETSLRVFA